MLVEVILMVVLEEMDLPPPTPSSFQVIQATHNHIKEVVDLMLQVLNLIILPLVVVEQMVVKVHKVVLVEQVVEENLDMELESSCARSIWSSKTVDLVVEEDGRWSPTNGEGGSGGSGIVLIAYPT